MSTSAPPLPLQNHGGAHVSTPSRRERDETYWGVIVALSDRWRVILCKDEIQFILQKHYAESLHGGVWRGQSYSTTRDGLIAACVRRDCLSEASQDATARRAAVNRSRIRRSD